MSPPVPTAPTTPAASHSPASRERVVTRRSVSGRITMQIIRPNGYSATAQFPTQAEAFAHIDWLRGHIDRPGAPQRGPAATFVPFTEVAR